MHKETAMTSIPAFDTLTDSKWLIGEDDAA